MKKLILAISVFILFGSSLANAEQVYYCMDELATGFKKINSSVWKSGAFKEQRHTVKFNDDHTKLIGLSGKLAWDCKTPWIGLSKHSTERVCYPPSHNGELFQFNFKTLRFLYVNTPITGYVHNYGNSDSNAIEVGTCQKF